MDDTLRIHEFLGMNQPRFTYSSVRDDPENFIEVHKKFFDILHVVNAERVELSAYQLKSIASV